MLRKWAEGDYKTDPQLNIIPSLYHTLRQEGHDFSVTLEAVSVENLIVSIDSNPSSDVFFKFYMKKG